MVKGHSYLQLLWEMLPLILENSLFPCIIAIFLKNILVERRTFCNLFKWFSSSGIGSNTILLQTILDMGFHFYKDAFDMFQICVKVFKNRPSKICGRQPL